MDFATIYLIGALVSILPAGHAVFRDFGNVHWVPGAGWDGKPTTEDWVFGALIVPLLCLLVWPLTLVYATVGLIVTSDKRKKFRVDSKARKQKQAFKQMKEARECLLKQKRDDHRASASEWEAAYHEADTKERDRRHAEYMAGIERRRKERFEEEVFFSAKDGYFTHSYCPHGHSRSYHCSLCS